MPFLLYHVVVPVGLRLIATTVCIIGFLCNKGSSISGKKMEAGSVLLAALQLRLAVPLPNVSLISS
jgi:hypothetical protein